MKFVHTADWHLGRILHGQSLLDDQRWWLERFIAFVGDERPDAVVIAGDVYDRAVPPSEAVALLDDTLAALVRDAGVPVLVVAGNHDSPERVDFGARVFDVAGLHVAGSLGADVRSAVVGSGDEATRFWLLPYADPIETRAAFGLAGIHDHEAAVAAAVERIRAEGATEPYQVIVTHHFVAGGLTSESERGLSVGGTGEVAAGLFEGFDFVALGHLHRPQSPGGQRIHYAGSPLKYSFDEAGHDKSVSVVELAGGVPAVRRVSLGARRDMRRLTGPFEDVLFAATVDASRDDYVEIILDETTIPPDAHVRLREFYPNLLSLRRTVDGLAPDAGSEALARHVETLSDEQLFENFFEYSTGDALSESERAVLHELIAERDRGEAR